jgi:RHS repeat-associated protein
VSLRPQRRTTTYDGFGRTIKVQTGHDSTTVYTVDTVYGACGCSPLGKVVKVSMPYGPGETEVWTTYTYDGSGRQLTSAVPDGSVTATSYSGNSVTATDPAGAWKTNVMDAFGNLTTVYEPDPATGSPSTGPATYYAYNGANQLTSVYMLRGGVAQTRAFTYNGSDMLTETTPEAGTVTYTYDGNHHVTSRIDALNQKTAYTYDSYERLTLVQHYTWGISPQCSSGCVAQWNEQANQDVSYYYDSPVANDYTQNYTWGRLSAVVFAAQTYDNQGPFFAYEYSYNQAGRVTGNRMLMTQGSNYLDLQGQYAWDNQGRMTQMTYPSGPVMNYQFDAMGRVSTIMQANQPTYLPTTATYGSAGQVLSLQWGTNAQPFGETRTYNNMLQITSFGATQYIYNTGHNNGRVAQTVDNILGETVNYTYDYLHRLTGATATNGAWGEAYAYDGFGNLTSKTPTVGSAPAFTANNSPTTNTSGQPNMSVTWDVEKRVVATNPPNSADNYTYVYDPWGRRIWKQDYNSYAGSTTCEVYFYGATGQKLESYSCVWQNGQFGKTLQGINTYFGGKMLSEKGVLITTDRLGSVRSNSNGETFSYYPWGEERGAGTADGRTKFAGYYRDMPGQDYAMARYYSGTAGSFWSPDPGGVKTADSRRPSSWNRYGYTEGDPINFVDSQGLFQENPCAADPTQIGCDPGTPPVRDPNPGGGGPSGGGGGGGGGGASPTIPVPLTAPSCAQNQAFAAQALNNIVGAVGQVLSNSGFSAPSISQIEGDLRANETAPGDVGFVGGHFNLILTATQINDLNANGSTVGTDVTNLFVGGTDGSASGVFGLFGNGPRHDQPNGTSLHSQASGSGGIDFHLDLGNPYNDIAGIISHIGHDILPPRIGRKPCLDAPLTPSVGGH